VNPKSVTIWVCPECDSKRADITKVKDVEAAKLGAVM